MLSSQLAGLNTRGNIKLVRKNKMVFDWNHCKIYHGNYQSSIAEKVCVFQPERIQISCLKIKLLCSDNMTIKYINHSV